LYRNPTRQPGQASRHEHTKSKGSTPPAQRAPSHVRPDPPRSDTAYTAEAQAPRPARRPTAHKSRRAEPQARAEPRTCCTPPQPGTRPDRQAQHSTPEARPPTQPATDHHAATAARPGRTPRTEARQQQDQGTTLAPATPAPGAPTAPAYPGTRDQPRPHLQHPSQEPGQPSTIHHGRKRDRRAS